MKNKNTLIYLFIIIFVLLASFYLYQSVFAQNSVESLYEWDQTIDQHWGDPRFFGGETYYYRFDQCTSSTCSNSCPNSRLDEDWMSPFSQASTINNSQEKVMLREIVNSGWNLVCDSDGKNESWIDRENLRTGCIHSGSESWERNYLYVDMGEDAVGGYNSYGERLRKGMELSYFVEGADQYSQPDFYSFDEEKNIILKNNTSRPDDIKRLEIYAGGVFLKTIFPDPSTEVSFSIKASDFLNLDSPEFNVSGDYVSSGLRVIAYGSNSRDTVSIYSRVFQESETYFTDVAPDITVYGSDGSYRRANYFVVNSLEEPVYINNKYIEPSMTPITIKGDVTSNYRGNFVRGSGWFMELDEEVRDFDFVDIGYISQNDVYYENEPINVYVSSYYSNTEYNNKIISNVMLDGAPLGPSQYEFDAVNELLIIPSLTEGTHNISYDLVVNNVNGNTWEDNENKDVLIIKNQLDDIRDNSFSKSKKYSEGDVTDFQSRYTIDYTSSWGSSGRDLRRSNIGNEDREKSIKQLVFQTILSDSETGWERNHGDTKWKLGNDTAAIDYDGSVDYTVNFFDGGTISGTLNVRDILNVNKIKDIDGVGTAFEVDIKEEYISTDYYSNGNPQVYFNVAFDTWEKDYGVVEADLYPRRSVSGETFMIGNNNFFGILGQPYIREQWGHPSSQVAVSELQDEIYHDNPMGELDLGHFNIVNIPFSMPYSYKHDVDSCPIPDGIDVLVDEPPTPPTPPKPDSFKLNATTTTEIDCYTQSETLMVNLSWGDDFTGELGYSVYLDSNDDGVFDDNEEIIYLQENSTSTTHDLSQDPNFTPNKTYIYQVKVWLESGEYTSEDSITVPEECYIPEPLDCGLLTQKSSTPSETVDNMCSVDASVVTNSLNVKANKLGWDWECAQDTNTIECSAFCPDPSEEWICGGVCQPTSQPCNNTCTEGYRICNGECKSELEPCNNGCEDGYILDEIGNECVIDEENTSSVDILQFVSNPSIINPGDSCLFDWQIDTENSNLISCTITSDNPKDAPENLNIRKNEIGKISGSTIDDSDYPFVNVDSTTEYTLTCNEYDPDTNIVGSVIDSEKTKCMINPAFYEF